MALSNIVPLLQFSPKHMQVKQRNVDEPGATILNDRREVNQTSFYSEESSLGRVTESW